VFFGPERVDVVGTLFLSTDTVEGGFRSDGSNGGEEEIPGFDVQTGGGWVPVKCGLLEIPDVSGVEDVCVESGSEVDEGDSVEEGG